MARTIDIYLRLSPTNSYYLEINESFTDGIIGDEAHRYTWNLPGVSLHRDRLVESPSFGLDRFVLIKEGTNESISFSWAEVVTPAEANADDLEVTLESYIKRPVDTTGGGGGGGGNVVVTNTPLPITGTVAISGEVEVKNDVGNPLPISVADGADVTLGAQVDAVAGSDSGTFSLISLIKRLLTQFTTYLTRIPASLTGSGNFRTAILEPLPSGTNTIGDVTVSNEVEVTNDSGNPLTVEGTVNIGNFPLDYARESHQAIYALNFGAQGDAAAITDTGAASYMALFKRLLTQFSVFLTRIPASLTGSGNFRTAILEPLPAGTNALGSVTVSNEIEISNDAGNPIPVTGTVIAEFDPKLLFRDSALGLTGVQISNVPGRIHKIFATNVNGAERSIKFFDQVAAPTVGIDPILYTVTVSRVGQGGTLDVSFEHPIEFTNALWVAATTSASDTANTYAGTDLIIQVSYE